MKVLLTGATGQLGNAVVSYYEKFLTKKNINLIVPSRKELDFNDFNSVKKVIKFHEPNWIINSAAYTAVDQAEDEKTAVRNLNTLVPIKIAEIMKDYGGKFLQISSDYVFSGSQNLPYKTSQSINPINFYGKTKAECERGLLKVLGENSFILRTSWVYGITGKNFLLTMLKLHKKFSNESIPLKVVVDQIGVPTNVKGLAKCCWKIINKKENSRNIYHWSDAGVTSWYDFAVAIGEMSVSINLLKDCAEVLPIKTSEFPSKAKRPSYSVLDTFSSLRELKLKNKHWKRTLLETLLEIKDLNLIEKI